jgi:uncharacterized membrane protein
MFWQAGLMRAGTIVFWGLLIWGIYALISTATRRPGEKQHSVDALGILQQWLARGEIGADEYRRLRDLIDSAHAGAPVSGGARRDRGPLG